MTKREFIDQYAKSMGSTKKDAEKHVKTFLELVETNLVSGEPISFIGFGKFEVVTRAARTVTNPQTKKKMKIKARKAVKFKVGKSLAEKVK